MVVCAELDAHDGKLPARSLQSDRFRSRLSSVEKLLRDDSQLRFWLRLFEWKLVTTPLDELLLAYEFSRWMDGVGRLLDVGQQAPDVAGPDVVGPAAPAGVSSISP